MSAKGAPEVDARWGGRAGDAQAATPRRIAGNAILQAAGRGGNIALGVVTVALLARALGPGDFGVWSTALAYVGLFSFLTDFGFAQVATQRMSAEPERETEWLGAVAAMRTLAAVVALLLCVAGIPLLGAEADLRAVALVLSITVVTAAASSLRSVFDSRLRAEVTMALLTFQSVLWFGAVLTLSTVGASVLDFAWAFVATSLAFAAAQLAVTRRYAVIALRRSRELWKPLVKIALPLGIGGLLVTVYYRIDSVLVFELAGPQEAGFYGAAYRFLDPLHFFPTAVMATLFPVLSAAYGRDRQRVAELVQRAVDYLAVLSLPILGLSIAVAEPLVGAIFGRSFLPAAEVLPVLMLAYVSISIAYLAGYLVPVVGLQWRFVAIAAVGAAANVALNLLLIPEHGAVGAAWATVVTEFSTMGLLLASVLRRMRLRPSAGRLLRTLLAGSIMTGVAALAVRWGLFAGLAAAVPVYVAALLGLRVVVPAEILALRRRRGG